MRYLILTILIAAFVIGVAPYGMGALDPQNDTIKTDTMTVAELERAGDTARVEKNFDLAIRYFRAAVNKDRKNARLYNKLGLSYLKADNFAEARSNFERAAKRDSKFADALNNIGAVHYVQRNYGAAARYFKKALALDETRPAFHVNLGAAWFGQNKLERAIAEYRRAVQLDPEALSQNSRAGVTAQIGSPEERARYEYMLAKIYAQSGDVEKCLRCLKSAKENGYRNMANVYKEDEFSRLWQDARLFEIVPPPAPK